MDTDPTAETTNRGGLRKRTRPYQVPLPSPTARLTCISFRALGILALLLDMREGWDVRAEQLANDGKRGDGTGADGKPHLREGREAVRTALWELAAAGLYRLERRQGRDGRFRMGTAIADQPIAAWAEQAGVFGDQPIPVVEQADGTFHVRYPDGTTLPEDQSPPATLERVARKTKKPRQAPRQGTKDTSTGTGAQTSVPGGPGPKKPESGKPATGNASPLVEPSSRDHEVETDHPSDDPREAAAEPESDSTGAGGGSVQPTLDGSVPAQRDDKPSAKDEAFAVARDWVNHRARERKPVVVGGRKAGALHAVKNLLAPFLAEGYTVKEIKQALNGLDIGCPSAQQMERALNRVRHGASAPAGTNGHRVNGRGRPTAEVLDVNAAWREPAEVSTGGATGW